ncbi:hypothetical protein IPA_01175 [Ignicoccus pacificus DSM 13166]|uniref:Uncharacterized protein n=1 Tax=Ignicoccus pacificus DSM 13166 TaxID=940294 RepID=A0A977PL25_9CREN|nr:hypothetical protein IPA_01175 [Ignicoccus pacificus DSM 13166]
MTFLISAAIFRLSGLDWPVSVLGLTQYLIFLLTLLAFSYSLSLSTSLLEDKNNILGQLFFSILLPFSGAYFTELAWLGKATIYASVPLLLYNIPIWIFILVVFSMISFVGFLFMVFDWRVLSFALPFLIIPIVVHYVLSLGFTPH